MEMVGFAIVIVVMVSVIVRRQYIKTKMNTQKKMEMAANQLQLQIEEVADTVISRMENRIDHLEMLIGEADGIINQLNQKIQDAHEMKNQNVMIETNEERSHNAPLLVPNVDKEASVSGRLPKKQPKQHLSDANKIALELLEKGDSIDEVAKRTGMGKGAILLIRELYK